MLYSILIYVPEDLVDAMSTEEIDAHIAKHLVVHDQLRAQDRLGPVVRLMPTTTAVQLRTSNTPHVVDGPFAETKEQLLGFTSSTASRSKRQSRSPARCRACARSSRSAR